MPSNERPEATRAWTRWYRSMVRPPGPCTRCELNRHDGREPLAARTRARNTIVSSEVSTASMTTPDRCGSRVFTIHNAHRDMITRPRHKISDSVRDFVRNGAHHPVPRHWDRGRP